MSTPTQQEPTRAEPAVRKVLHTALIVDMSGSMHVVHQPTIEAVNEYLKGLKEEAAEGNETLFSLTIFDTEVEEWVVEQPVEGVPYSLMTDRYQPRGNTALYDSIATTIQAVDGRMKAISSRRADLEDKVMVVVFTDGQENSSVEYPQFGQTRGAKPSDQGAAWLSKLIKSYEDRGNWTFIYISSGHANLSATQAYAASAGFSAGNTAHYTSDAASVRATTESLTNVTKTRRASAAPQSSEAFADAGESQEYGTPGGKAPTPDEGPQDTEAFKEQSIDKLLRRDK